MERPLLNINLCIEIRHSSWATSAQSSRQPCIKSCLVQSWMHGTVFTCYPFTGLAVSIAIDPLLSNLYWPSQPPEQTSHCWQPGHHYTHRHASSAAQSSIKAERLVYVTLDDKNCFCLAVRESLCYVQIKRGIGWRICLLARPKYIQL